MNNECYEGNILNKALEEMKNTFGMSIVPIQYPIGRENNFSGIIFVS